MTGAQAFTSLAATLTAIVPRFKNELDDKYSCVKCKRVLRPPVQQIKCGHRICKDCLDDVIVHNDKGAGAILRCLGDDEECAETDITQVFRDVGMDRELSRMTVYCPNEKHGCKAQMKWMELAKHLQECMFSLVKCPNDGCEEQCTKKNIEHHAQNECGFSRILCEVCNTMVTRSEMDLGHRTVCETKERVCKMSSLGCNFKGKSSEVTSHERDMQYHFGLLVNTTLTQQNTIKQLTTETTQLKEENIALKQELSELKIEHSHLREAYTQRSNRIEKTLASHSEKFINYENYEENLKINLSEMNAKLLTTQDIVMVHQGKLANFENGPMGSGRVASARLDEMERSIQSCHLKMAENDIRFRCIECASYDGTLIWKISNYRRRKADAVQGKTLSLYSQPFYTGPFGYKMCARVYLNGDGMGKGTHISLFFVIMKGEYDALLSWPFRQRVSLTLVDQESGRKSLTDTFRPDPSSTSFKQPSGDMNVASGCPLFVAQSVVESNTYLRNDTLFLKLQVKLDE